MKAGKKLRLSVAILCLLGLTGGSMLYAAAGDSVVAVYLNNKLLKYSGIASGGQAYLPVEQLPEQLHLITTTGDSGSTVRVYKPNVNIALIDGEGRIFGKVRSGVSNTFLALVQVDSLKTEVSDIKITITDPDGKTETLDTRQIKENKENFWFKSAEYTGSFSTKGDYSVQVYFKTAAAGGWNAVAEILISTI